MKKIAFILLPAAAFALSSCENPADNSTAAKVSEAKEVAEGDVTGQKWVFTEDSNITFVGSKVTGSHSGGFKDISGYFHVEGETLATSGHQVVIDMKSTWSDDDDLTAHLKAPDFFDVEKYPNSTFTATGLTEKSGSKGETHVLTGNFEFHGVTKSLDIPVTVQQSADEITIKADFFINRFDFNVKYPGETDDLIREEVVIRFDLKAQPES
ncbi:YceI family protein [Persicirhabdus sediminis]|uniref:YceI family protein n=1 Tax=Persicirhabdus sediminis TaxID=454144 RepID=A0A8J7MEA5_9BACT|nr:YceI family protein [Persicirhabdus sediminis]MBK1791691.1 YceI family protein [Persicirhabdus sediminis]